jgi:hypothetical protein
LQYSQKQNQSGFWKVYQESLWNSMDDFFSGNPFFDNSLLNQKSDVKDW